MNPNILNNLTYGMYAIGVKDGKKPSACIINSVTQISRGAKCCVAICMCKSSYSAECIIKEKIFSVSVLSEETPGTIIGALGLVSGRDSNKLDNVRHKVLIEGIPVIKENSCCWYLCKLKNYVETDGQYIFIGEIVAGSDKSLGIPMTYNFYREKLGGSAPKNSPVYIKPTKTFDTNCGNSFICSVCGYIYNDPNFSFEELRDHYKCPICGVPKQAFVRYVKV